MQELTTVARPYAQAVFDLAQESATAAEWSVMLQLLARIVADGQMRFLLNNPKVSDEQLQELVIGIAGASLSRQAQNFVKVLVSASRLQYMPQITRLFEAMWAAAEGRVEVEVCAAYELTQAQQDTIASGMSARLDKKVSIRASVDADLIGGAVIRAGDSVIDASLRGRLLELGKDLI